MNTTDLRGTVLYWNKRPFILQTDNTERDFARIWVEKQALEQNLLRTILFKILYFFPEICIRNIKWEKQQIVYWTTFVYCTVLGKLLTHSCLISIPLTAMYFIFKI